MRLLVIDDDLEVQSLLLRALRRDGHVVTGAGSIATARTALVEEAPDVIVLDCGLPDGTGFALCRELREAGDRTPILFLTARSEVARRVEGFEVGGDDFLGKPFAVAELRARVRALGRRRDAFAAVRVMAGDVAIDLGARTVTRDGVEVPLTVREWAIVEALALRGRVVSGTELLQRVWGEATESARASLEVLLVRIRKKLGPDVIRTRRGEGYVLGASGGLGAPSDASGSPDTSLDAPGPVSASHDVGLSDEPSDEPPDEPPDEPSDEPSDERGDA